MNAIVDAREGVLSALLGKAAVDMVGLGPQPRLNILKHGTLEFPNHLRDYSNSFHLLFIEECWI
ncbi:hypothetical protein RRF57_000035 [Xylaria bambusicola]|uniref:Uncharacterized protein n=1 Tax=Xylaria bambusicola TaxID=326684 RepID=A0AAN7UMW1_9PEZI